MYHISATCEVAPEVQEVVEAAGAALEELPGHGKLRVQRQDLGVGTAGFCVRT